MRELRSVIGIAILFIVAFLAPKFSEEPELVGGHGLTFSNPENRSKFIDLLKTEGIPYRYSYDDYIIYDVSGFAKVRAFLRSIYGSTDYSSVAPLDSRMEHLFREEFEEAGIPFTIRVLEGSGSLTTNFSYEAKYDPQVDQIAQRVWMDRAEGLKKTNEAVRGYPQ